MAFILSSDFLEESRNDPKLISARFAAYQDYLQSIRQKLPTATYEFAIADSHYNPEAHECPHDSWVESLNVSEPSSGERWQYRSIAINLRLLGAYHDGHINLEYREVRSYSLQTPATFKMPPLGVGHGDWLTDEIRLSERGLVLHEIEFSRGSTWLIECEDIFYEWQPILDHKS
jgi:hypothetical protein